MGVESILETTGGHLFIPQVHLNLEQQLDFTAALETGEAIWYQGNCWIVLEYFVPAGQQATFVLSQVPDRECKQS